MRHLLVIVDDSHPSIKVMRDVIPNLKLVYYT